MAGDNFGCGSSREHAPWAIADFGIKVIISTSFADIFYNNCFKNGILPIKLSQSDVDKLMDDAERGANATVSVDWKPRRLKALMAARFPSTLILSASIACWKASTMWASRFRKKRRSHPLKTSAQANSPGSDVSRLSQLT